MDFFSLLKGISFWHWLAFGFALLAVELLGTAGYFLWLGMSALIVGAIMTVLPMSWQLQWLCFASFSLITTWLWWRRQWSKDKQEDQERDLNQKYKQLIGRTLILEEDFSVGLNRIKVADTTWSAQSDQALPAGTRVRITDVEGIILIIEPDSN
ncbi:NfeD family protein [Vibrio alginolyticus]|uniref:NfeD family protein n=1 Tax=Vibrio alginolyticus TaxID=663 RepID=UPI0012AD77C5|nr:NfeD family protein [Vibrio alginolyticus]EJL6926950.1 NfeD family protein [Vibrio alginolyticus]ELB2749984.1 NfeD family protein [Vibrio alginolyticus]MCQ9061008.1 NfeD family protein [Vibrio alginolyticus]MCS0146949.1 NfeD family protein [Vibrio alginolyticus]